MHRDAALTTAEQQRVPLVAVVALPAVLAPGAASAGAGRLSVDGSSSGSDARITAHIYHDAGDELEVGAGGWVDARACTTANCRLKKRKLQRSASPAVHSRRWALRSATSSP